jgi:hypothetical protein
VPTEVDYIGFDQNGNLYGIDNTNSVLYHLNPNTGSVLGTVFLNGASVALHVKSDKMPELERETFTA